VHNHGNPSGAPGSVLAGVEVDTPLGPFRVTVSPSANERYWRAAGVTHPLLETGALYPPIAANLTVLMFLEHCPHQMIQTRQRLRCHRIEPAGAALVVTGRVAARYQKRGREYVDVEADVCTEAQPDQPLWTSFVSFTPAAELER
jgi:hypothetical protein